MEIRRTERFKRSFRKLSLSDQQRIETALKRFEENPQHPSLHLERLNDDWSLRASLSIRVFLQFAEDPQAHAQAAAILRDVTPDHDYRKGKRR